MRNLFFSIAFLSSIFAANAQETLTLQQCVEQAWANNLQVKQNELSIEANESQLKNAKANVLPNVNGFASHNYNWGQRIDPFTNLFATTRVQSNSFGLSSSVTLFNGLQNYQNIKSQEAGLESVKYDLETQKNNIALSVSAAFLQVLLVEELIVSAEQQVMISTNQLDRVRKLVDAGASNIGVQYELESQLSRDRSTLTQRRNDYQLAQLQLKQIMMIPADESLVLVKPDIEADSTIRLEKASIVYSYAETAMPEIKSAEYSLLSWDRQLQSVKSGYYPSLTLSGSIGSGYSGLRTTVESVMLTGEEQIGYTSSGESVLTPTFDATLTKVPFGTQLNDNFNQFVGLSLNVPIFNRYAVKNQVKQAEVNRTIAELQLEQEKLGLRQRIESARTDALAAKELYKANRAALRSATTAFEFAEKRFEAGASNVVEFNNSKNNLRQAEAEVARTMYDYVFKTKVLDFYMGKPLGFVQ
ncbi:MAG: TolC family protein [Cryomorphaceae bacterium]